MSIPATPPTATVAPGARFTPAPATATPIYDALLAGERPAARPAPARADTVSISEQAAALRTSLGQLRDYAREALTLAARTPLGATGPAGTTAAAAGAEVDGRELFTRFEHRVTTVSPYLQEDDKEMLGLLYADREAKFGADSEEMVEVDRFARELAFLRQVGILIDGDYLREKDRREGRTAPSRRDPAAPRP